MFSSGTLFGWKDWIGQSILALLAAAFILAVAHRLGTDLAAMLAFAPIILFLMLSHTYVLTIVFVCFSYFRLHEAYPPLADLRIIAITGAALIAGLLWRGFRVRGTGRLRISELRVLALAFSFGAIGTGMAMSASDASYTDAHGLALGTATIIFFCAAMITWRLLMMRSDPYGWPRAMTYFTAFFIFASVTTPMAIYPNTAFSHFIEIWWKIGIVVYAIAWFASRERDFVFTMAAVMVSGAAIAAVAIYNKFMGIDLIEGTRVTIGLMLFAPENSIMPLDMTKNYASALGDPNELALVLLFPLGFAGALLFYPSSRWLTALALITLLGSMLAIIYTESRGGLLGVLAVGGIIGLKVIKSRMLLFAGGGVAAIALFVAMGLGDRATAIGADGGIDDSSMGRLYSWLAAIHMTMDHPLTGIGMFNFPSAHVNLYAISLNGHNKAVHSTYLAVLAESGIIGLALFTAMFISALQATRWSLKRLEELGASKAMIACALGLFAALVGFAIAGAFLTHGFTWPFFMLVAFVIALWRFVRRLEIEKAERDEERTGYAPWGPPQTEKPRLRAAAADRQGEFA